MFIVFEWGEWAGKTTQLNNTKNYLEGIWKKVYLTREPGWSWSVIAEKIRTLIKDPENKSMDNLTELFLFLASRAQHVNEVILPKLNDWYIVISDRYYWSNLAYQHYARWLFDYEILKYLNNLATSELYPDLTIYFDLDAQKWLSRRDDLSKCRLDSESLNFHENVRRWFHEIIKKEENWYLIDAWQEWQEKVFEDIQKLIDKYI